MEEVKELPSLRLLQRRAESLLGVIKLHDDDAASRYEAALDQFWFDHPSMLELVSDMRTHTAELIRER